MPTFTTAFELGDKVLIDGDPSLVLTVIGFSLYSVGQEIRCSWFNEGVHHTDWFYEWRLTRKV